ncbi:LuxR C-terminal-related transcriptional regulator [Sphingopyxis sp.]|uniref:LuxR C-terminal-related transcriptional regulator n=1 Tax=Sphingopyxis sp. TaxID=1908224 RepID=UPI003D0CDAEE
MIVEKLSSNTVGKEILSTVVVGRNTLAREGLRRILADDDFTIAALVESGADLPSEFVANALPALFILDNGDGEQITIELEVLNRNFPKSRKVVLADEFEFERVADAFKSGADGYFVKAISCEALMESLRLVVMGQKVMPSELALHLSGVVRRNEMPQISPNADVARILSEREITTLRYLLVGHSNKEIARRLEISEATVKVYVKAILRKLRVSNRTQAAIWAFNNGVKIGAVDVADTFVQNDMDASLMLAAT